MVEDLQKQQAKQQTVQKILLKSSIPESFFILDKSAADINRRLPKGIRLQCIDSGKKGASDHGTAPVKLKGKKKETREVQEQSDIPFKYPACPTKLKSGSKPDNFMKQLDSDFMTNQEPEQKPTKREHRNPNYEKLLSQSCKQSRGYKLCRSLLAKLSSMEQSSVFDTVLEEGSAHAGILGSQRLDLKIISEKLEKSEYLTIQQCFDDVSRMFQRFFMAQAHTSVESYCKISEVKTKFEKYLGQNLFDTEEFGDQGVYVSHYERSTSPARMEELRVLNIKRDQTANDSENVSDSNSFVKLSDGTPTDLLSPMKARQVTNVLILQEDRRLHLELDAANIDKLRKNSQQQDMLMRTPVEDKFQRTLGRKCSRLNTEEQEEDLSYFDKQCLGHSIRKLDLAQLKGLHKLIHTIGLRRTDSQEFDISQASQKQAKVMRKFVQKAVKMKVNLTMTAISQGI